MKPYQFYLSLTLAVATLVLSITTISLGQSSISLQNTFQKRQLEVQTEVQQRQADINRGGQTQQIGTTLLKEIANAAYNPNGTVKNEKLKELLTKNGITVTANPSPAKAP